MSQTVVYFASIHKDQNNTLLCTVIDEATQKAVEKNVPLAPALKNSIDKGHSVLNMIEACEAVFSSQKKSHQ